MVEGGLSLIGSRAWDHRIKIIVENGYIISCRFCIAMAFIGWISFVVTLILQHTLIIQPRHDLDLQQRCFWRSEKGIRLAFTLLGVVVVTLLYGELSASFIQYIFHEIFVMKTLTSC